MEYTQYDSMGVPYAALSNLPPGTMIDPSTGGLVYTNNPKYTSPDMESNTALGLSELATLHAQLLVNGNLIATGTGDSQTQQNPVATERKPWLDAPDGAVPFDPQTAVALPTILGTTAVIVSYLCPDGRDGVINAYSWNFTGGGFVDGSGDIVVQILRNGVPIRNYENIVVQKGSIQIARPIAPLRVYSKDLIQMVVNHVANGLLAGDVVGSFVGYDYPSRG